MIPIHGPCRTLPHPELRPWRGQVTPLGNQEYDAQWFGIDPSTITVPVAAPGPVNAQRYPYGPIHLSPAGGATRPALCVNYETRDYYVVKRSDLIQRQRQLNTIGFSSIYSNTVFSRDQLSLVFPNGSTIPAVDSSYIGSAAINVTNFQNDGRFTFIPGTLPQFFESGSLYKDTSGLGAYYDTELREWVPDCLLLVIFDGDVLLTELPSVELPSLVHYNYYIRECGIFNTGGVWYRATWRVVHIGPHLKAIGTPSRVKLRGNDSDYNWYTGTGVPQITDPAGIFRPSVSPQAWLQTSDRTRTVMYLRQPQGSSPTDIFQGLSGSEISYADSVRIEPSYGIGQRDINELIVRHTPITGTLDNYASRAELGDSLLCELLSTTSGSVLQSVSLRRCVEEDFENNQDIFGYQISAPNYFQNTSTNIFVGPKGFEAWIGESPTGATVLVWSLNRPGTSNTGNGVSITTNANYGVWWGFPDSSIGGIRTNRMQYDNNGVATPTPIGRQPFTYVTLSPFSVFIPMAGRLDQLINGAANTTAPVQNGVWLSLKITEGGSAATPPSVMPRGEVWLYGDVPYNYFVSQAFSEPLKITLDGSPKFLAGPRIKGLSPGWHEIVMPTVPGMTVSYRWQNRSGEAGDTIFRNRVVFPVSLTWKTWLNIGYSTPPTSPIYTFDSTQSTLDTTTQWTWDRG